MDSSPRVRLQLIGILCLFMVFGFLIYLRGLQAPFLFDDIFWIRDNPNLRATQSFESLVAFNRPMVMLSYKANYAVCGNSPAGFRLFSILLHGVNAFLLFRLAIRLMRFFRGRNALDPLTQTVFPPLAGLLFLISPLQSMAVMMSAYRGDLLCAFFYLLGLLYFLDYLERRSRFAWAGVCATFCFGLLSKETMITFPAVCLALHLFHEPFGFRFLRRHWKIYFFLGLGALALLVRMASFSYGGTVGAETALMSRSDFFLTQVTIWTHYLKVFALPLPAWLSGDWDWPLVHTLWNGAFLAAVVLLAVAAGLLVRAARRGKPLPAWSMLFFFLAILPFSSIIPINDPLMEYRVYLPVAGLALTLAFILASVHRLAPEARFALSTRVLIVGLVALAVFSANLFLLADRLSVYRSPLAFWQDAAAKSPRKDRIWLNLGHVHLEEGRFEPAMAAARMAVHVAPESELGWVLQGDVHQVLDESAAALRCYEKAHRLRPGAVEPVNRIVGILADLGQVEEALQLLRQVIYRGKDENCLANLAKILSRQGKYPQAVDVYRQAVRRSPEDYAAWMNYGNILLKLRAWPQAEEAYLQAIAVNPRYYLVYYNLGNLYFQLGQVGEAETAFRNALERNPSFEPSRFSLASLLAATRRYAEARPLLEQSLTAMPTEPTVRVKLALVLQELGQSDGAHAVAAPLLASLRMLWLPLAGCYGPAFPR